MSRRKSELTTDFQYCDTRLAPCSNEAQSELSSPQEWHSPWNRIIITFSLDIVEE